MVERKGRAMGMKILSAGSRLAIVERITRESKIKVEVDRGEKVVTSEINTGISFLDHMLETICWRACMNMRVAVENFTKLKHVVCEDVRITLGAALL